MSYWEGSVGASQEWYTPPQVFDALGCRFDLDVTPARYGTADGARAWVIEQEAARRRIHEELTSLHRQAPTKADDPGPFEPRVIPEDMAGSDYTPADAKLDGDGLVVPWAGFAWMNPPFGGRNGIEPWLDRFFDHGNGIALAPDRTSAPWFWKAWQRADRVLFTRKIRFIRPDGTEGVSPSNGTALFAVGQRGIHALEDAAGRGFGILAKPLEPSEAAA